MWCSVRRGIGPKDEMRHPEKPVPETNAAWTGRRQARRRPSSAGYLLTPQNRVSGPGWTFFRLARQAATDSNSPALK